MRIGIVGSGMIGSTAARLFAGVGHEVVIANRRGLASLADLANELGPRVAAGTVRDAARFGELVLVAVPFGAIEQLPAEAFAGKLVIDAGNYYPGRDGHFPELDRDQTTSTELLAAHLSGATVVKSLNTMYYSTLARSLARSIRPARRAVR